MKGKIPIKTNGEMYSYVPSDRQGDYTWEDHLEWEGQLNFQYIGYRGHSYFHDLSGREWIIFSSDANEVLKKMEKGVVYGKWRTVKRGQSFGIMPVDN